MLEIDKYSIKKIRKYEQIKQNLEDGMVKVLTKMFL